MAPAHRILGLGLLLALVVAACSSGSNTDTASDATDLPAGTEDLVGRYAHYDVVAYQDTTMKVLIISTGFSEL